MPKIELTMNQWGLVLHAVRQEMMLCRESGEDENMKDLAELLIAEDRIIDIAFQFAKETKDVKPHGPCHECKKLGTLECGDGPPYFNCYESD